MRIVAFLLLLLCMAFAAGGCRGASSARSCVVTRSCAGKVVRASVATQRSTSDVHLDGMRVTHVAGDGAASSSDELHEDDGDDEGQDDGLTMSVPATPDDDLRDAPLRRDGEEGRRGSSRLCFVAPFDLRPSRGHARPAEHPPRPTV